MGQPRKRKKDQNGCPPCADGEQSIEKNIQALRAKRLEDEARRSLRQRVVDAIAAFCGTIGFVYLHAVWFTAWVAVNQGWTPFGIFDPFPYGLLTMVVSLESIFLSSFLLLSQNRSMILDSRQSELDLQINLLAESETTEILRMLHAVIIHQKIPYQTESDIASLEEQVSPEHVLEKIKNPE